MTFAAGLTPNLLWLAAGVFLFGFFLCSRHIPYRFALPVSLIKIGIPVVYFARNPVGSLHLSDDLQYFNNAVSLLRMGFGPFSVFTDIRGWASLMAASGTGRHIVYPLWNLFGLNLFGPHYYVPVLMNVGLTFVSGWFFYKILEWGGFAKTYRRFAVVFFLLHWETITWSSFLNLKDTLLATLSLALLYQLLVYSRKPAFWRLIPLGLVLAIELLVRFYAPLMVLVAAAIYLAVQKKRFSLALLLIAGVALLPSWVPGFVAGGISRVRIPEVWTGVPQFLLTPLPWNLAAGYEFLLVSSVMHLLLIVPALLAIPALWKQSSETRLLLLYFGIVVLTFSVIPENRGIRQRQMISFVFAWLQFHALWAFARYALAEPARPSGEASRANRDTTAQAGPGQGHTQG
jgi:hypothetical protein